MSCIYLLSAKSFKESQTDWYSLIIGCHCSIYNALEYPFQNWKEMQASRQNLVLLQDQINLKDRVQ